MKLKIFATVLVLILLLLVVHAQGTLPTPANESTHSSKAPALEFKNLQGHSFRLSDYRGKVVLVNFWATWCPPCRTEIPELIKWQREYRDRGLRVVGVTYPPQKLAEVRRFARRTRVNYPIALGTKATKQLFTASQTLPMSVVIDREGNVREVIEGIVFPEEFDQRIKPLLTSQTVSSRHKYQTAKTKSAPAQKATILESVGESASQPTRALDYILNSDPP